MQPSGAFCGVSYLCIDGTLQRRAGTLNLIAGRVYSLAKIPGVFSPGSPLHYSPAEPATGAAKRLVEVSPAAASSREALGLTAPASHDFH